MDDPIKVGDLVVVVRSPCAHGDKELGRIFQVVALRFDCSHCRKCFHYTEHQWHCTDPEDETAGFPLASLKRIPPLDELESVKRDEEIHA